MTRDPQALHVGLHVLTPNGPGIIRARRGGPITTWLALDYWWRESQLTVPEPDEPQPVPGAVCSSCRAAGRRTNGGLHCGGESGVFVAGLLAPCGCRCRLPRWRDELETEVAR